ncbi:MAG: proton-conducting transporter membrane subunit [Planctomycetota bacterium]
MLVIAPILLPMLGAAVSLAFWGRASVQHAIAVACSAIALAVAVTLLVVVDRQGIQVSAMGGWAAPFGIALVADRFGAIMVLLGTIVGFAVCIYSIAATDSRRAANGHVPLVLSMLAAVSGAFLSGDLFNLYVWFELMLLSSFVLLTLGGERAQLEGAIKYVTLNLLSSVVFLATVGIIYASVGTLNMAHLAQRLDALEDPAFATLIGTPLLVAFGIKAAVFPLFFWLPASYHTPPPAVSALFAGLLTKVGVYSLIRATTLMFDQEQQLLGDAILIVAGLTMAFGVLGAVAQNDIRRILSFHIVSQIGYMLMGLGIALSLLGRPDADQDTRDMALFAMVGSVLYIMHHIIVKTNLFLIGGAVLKLRGSSELKNISGIVTTNPLLSGLFLVSALSLAGIPILSGFWAKLILVRAGLEAQAYSIVAVSLAVSLLTLLSMTKIWTQAFWGEAPDEVAPIRRRALGTMYAPIIVLAVLTLLIGFGAPVAYSMAEQASRSLLDPASYIDAVMPDGLPVDAEVPAEPTGGGTMP